MSVSVLKGWLESEIGTLSVTSLSLFGVDRLHLVVTSDQLIERFNRELRSDSSTPMDGLDAVAGSVIGWANRAMTMVHDSTER